MSRYLVKLIPPKTEANPDSWWALRIFDSYDPESKKLFGDYYLAPCCIATWNFNLENVEIEMPDITLLKLLAMPRECERYHNDQETENRIRKKIKDFPSLDLTESKKSV